MSISCIKIDHYYGRNSYSGKQKPLSVTCGKPVTCGPMQYKRYIRIVSKMHDKLVNYFKDMI